jgi:hypothetical protein
VNIALLPCGMRGHGAVSRPVFAGAES